MAEPIVRFGIAIANVAHYDGANFALSMCTCFLHATDHSLFFQVHTSKFIPLSLDFVFFRANGSDNSGVK